MSGEMTPAGAFDGELPPGVCRYYTHGVFRYLDDLRCSAVQACFIYEGRNHTQVRLQVKNLRLPSFNPVTTLVIDYGTLFDCVCMKREDFDLNGTRIIYTKGFEQMAFEFYDSNNCPVLLSIDFLRLSQFILKIETARLAEALEQM